MNTPVVVRRIALSPGRISKGPVDSARSPAAETAAEVSQLLRLAALERFPERNAAGLQGGAWIAFLESCDRAPGRFAALREALTAAPYSPRAATLKGASTQVDPLLSAARGWLQAVV